jgi:outer membrane protein assembly factor BamB/predicted phosphodiesterase
MRNKRVSFPAAFLGTLLLSGLLGAQPVRFAVIADTHVGANGAADGLRSVVEAVKAQPGLRFVVLDGDLTEKGRDDEFAEFKSIVAGLTVPIHAIPGNHDLHWMGFGGEGFRTALGESRFAFQEGGAAFIGMSAGDLGHFAPADLAWLAEAVRKMPPEMDLFFFVHYPPSSIDNWVRARNILGPHRICVISGHVHTESMELNAGIPVFTVRAALAGSGRPGFDVFEIGPDELTAESIADAKSAPPPWGRFSKAEWKSASAVPLAPPAALSARIVWKADLKTSLLAAPVTDGKLVFLADLFGRIHCFDAKGTLRWTHEGRSPFISRPVVFEKKLLAASADGRMIKLDAESGRLEASTEFRERFTAPLAAYEDRQVKVSRLVAGTASGRLICVNIFNLTDVWTSDAAKGTIQSCPLVTSGKAVFGAWDGAAHAVDIETGRELWRWTENDNFYYSPAGSTPAAAAGRVFFACPDGFVSAVEAGTGRTAWRVAADSWESSALSAGGKKVLVKGRQGDFFILDASSGAVLRKIAPAHGEGDLFPVEPLEEGGRILYGGQDGRVYEIDAGGAVRAILDLGPGAVHTILSLGGGRFLAADVDGLVAAFERT